MILSDIKCLYTTKQILISTTVVYHLYKKKKQNKSQAYKYNKWNLSKKKLKLQIICQCCLLFKSNYYSNDLIVLNYTLSRGIRIVVNQFVPSWSFSFLNTWRWITLIKKNTLKKRAYLIRTIHWCYWNITHSSKLSTIIDVFVFKSKIIPNETTKYLQGTQYGYHNIALHIASFN